MVKLGQTDEWIPAFAGITIKDWEEIRMGKHDARPLRTVLFCAGSEEADIVAGWNSGADSIVIDLEEPRTPFSEAHTLVGDVALMPLTPVASWVASRS